MSSNVVPVDSQASQNFWVENGANRSARNSRQWPIFMRKIRCSSAALANITLIEFNLPAFASKEVSIRPRCMWDLPLSSAVNSVSTTAQVGSKRFLELISLGKKVGM